MRPTASAAEWITVVSAAGGRRSESVGHPLLFLFSYHVPPDRPGHSAGAARPSTGSMDGSLSYPPRRGARACAFCTPTRAPYSTGGTWVGINSGGPCLGCHALSCACWFHACLCCVRAVSPGIPGGGYPRGTTGTGYSRGVWKIHAKPWSTGLCVPREQTRPDQNRARAGTPYTRWQSL